jgi:hypothetical protein
VVQPEKTELTDAEKQQEQDFQLKQQSYLQELSVYNRNVSMITLTLAGLILVLALTLSEPLTMIADGRLLGGIFTLLYGIGRGMATDNNQYRFVVAAVGLAVTLTLGYTKFS